MIKHVIKIAFIFTTLIIMLLHVQKNVYAQDSTTSASPQPMNVTLSPITMSIKTLPGESQSHEVKIRNNGTETEYLRSSFSTFTVDESGEKPLLLTPNPNDTWMSWITINEKEFSVSPGEWKTLTLTFSPPEEAALSYYYTLMFERVKTPTKTGETSVQGAPAILILTTVDSPLAKRDLQLIEFKKEQHFLEYLPQTFLIKIKNTGNVHVVPKGNIFIDGQGKNDLSVLSLNPSSLSVLPGTTREFRVSWDEGFPKRINKEQEVQKGINIDGSVWNFEDAEKFRVGKYDAHLLMVYDNGQRDVPIESQTSFYVIPWKLFLLVAIISILSLVGVKSTVTTLIKKIWNARKKLSK